MTHLIPSLYHCVCSASGLGLSGLGAWGPGRGLASHNPPKVRRWAGETESTRSCIQGRALGLESLLPVDYSCPGSWHLQPTLCQSPQGSQKARFTFSSYGILIFLYHLDTMGMFCYVLYDNHETFTLRKY